MLNRKLKPLYGSSLWLLQNKSLQSTKVVDCLVDYFSSHPSHKVNTESGDIVPFNQFYIPEIQETIDIRADYFNWIQNQVL